MRILFLLSLLATLLAADTKKILIDLTSGELDTVKTRLFEGLPGTIKYFQAEGHTVEAAVVIHGGAYKFFVANLEATSFWSDEALLAAQEELGKALKKLHDDYAIRFEVCQVGMNRRGILTKDLYPFVTPIKSAMVGLAKWQNLGYAYIPMP